MTLGAFFLCYLAVLFYALLARLDRSKANFWFSYALCFSTIVNPVIYYTTTNRFRFALKQFLKDPFGTIDLEQNAFLKSPRRGMKFYLANTMIRSYRNNRRNETAFVGNGANRSGEKARGENAIIYSVSSAKAGSQIVVGERGDASSSC